MIQDRGQQVDVKPAVDGGHESAELPAITDSFDRAGLVAAVGDTFSIEYAPVIDSTMQIAKYFSDRNRVLESRSVLIAGVQTQGKGYTAQSVWSSAGKDVKMTIALSDSDAAYSQERQVLYGTACGLAVLNAVKSLAGLAIAEHSPGTELRLKWLNDVYAVNTAAGSAKKLCGIMCVGKTDDNYGTASFIVNDKFLSGIGLNLAESAAVDSVGGTSVQGVSGVLFSREIVIAAVLQELDRQLVLLEGDPVAFAASIAPALWLSDTGKVKMTILEGKQATSCEGVILGVDRNGFQVEAEGRRFHVPFHKMRRFIPIE